MFETAPCGIGGGVGGNDGDFSFPCSQIEDRYEIKIRLIAIEHK